MKNTIKKKLILSLRLLPVAIVIGGMLYYNQQHDLFTAENIFEFTPKNLWVAALFFLVLYALKPVTLIVPLWALQLSCAMFFPPGKALLINTVGVGISVAVAYIIGFYLGKNKVQNMYDKIKKNKLIDGLKEEGQFFYVFIIRVIGIVSLDITGMIFGSMKINFLKYFLASLLGLMPAVIIGTFIGSTLSEPTSMAFIISILMKLILIMISIIIYRKKYKSPS